MTHTATLSDPTDITTGTTAIDSDTDSADSIVIPDGTLLLTVAEVAHELRVKPWLVYQLCDAGDLPSIYLGPKTRRVKRDDLKAYIDSRPDIRPGFERDKTA